MNTPPKSCPACGSVQLACHAVCHPDSNEQICPQCRAEWQLPLWKTHQPAYLRRRLWAAILDHFLAIPFTQVLYLLLFSWANLSTGYQLVLLQLLYPTYFFLLAGLFSTSFGKWVFGLSIVDAVHGTPLTWKGAWLREIVGRLLNAFLFPVGLITVVRSHSRAQTIADEVGQSVVLRHKQ